MPEIIFFVIIGILVFDFVLERTLALLNIKHATQPLPKLLADIFDHDQYQKQQTYFRTNSRFGIVSSSFSFVVVVSMYVVGGFGWLDLQLTPWIPNDMLRAFVFFGILFVANDLISVPFELYDTFVIEEKFGFNKVTPRIFITDKLKGYLLTLIIGGLLLAAVIFIYQTWESYFWLIAWALVTVFGLFMSMFYSEIIVPLFNKQTPLAEGELRTAIEDFATKTGFKLKNIYMIDGSKRSTKANAYFSGMGPKKRIVLYDTLLDKLSTNEVVAVLAHEIGHNKYKHTFKSMLVSMPSSLLLFYILGIVLNSDALAQALGGNQASFHLNILAFGIIYSPVSILIDLLGNYLSRKYEYQADHFTTAFGMGDALISALKKLSASSLSNLMPHPAYVFFHYSHPTLYQRIVNINKVSQAPDGA